MTNRSSDARSKNYGLDAESREMVVETVRQLKKRLLTKENILAYDKKEIFPEAVIREMLGPDIGLQLLFIPEAYGGMGGGAGDCCAVTREMAKICLGVGTAFFAIQLGADPIIVGGTERQKQKWLGAIAEGSALVAYAVTEAGAGSNLAALKTKAVPVVDEDGGVKGYTINGSKQFISTGGYADFITLLAKTDQGPSFFIVEKGARGFEQGKGEEKHGIRASNTSPLSFTDVYVPAENLIGEVPGMGLKQANQVFGYTRLMVAAMALGAAEAAMDIAVQYARERVQFGSALSDKQGYTHKLILPHVMRMEAAAAYIEETAARIDAGETDLQVEGSIAKLFTTETANRAADDAMQALGGYGYIAEYEVEKIKRDVKISCIYEGTSEIQQNIISTFRWKISRKTKGAFYADMASEMAAIDEDAVGPAARILGRCAEMLNTVVDLAHEHRLTRQQYLMFELADLMTAVEVGVSLARKSRRLEKQAAAGRHRVRHALMLFANEVARLYMQKVPSIVLSAGVLEPNKALQLLADMSYARLIEGHDHLLSEMDALADILFERSV